MELSEVIDRVKSMFAKVPDQAKRLAVLAVVLLAVFIPVRYFLIPHDFGELGHYRASALDEAASQEILYAGRVICRDCHDDIVELKHGGYHRDLSCELCHGPAADHTEDPGSAELPAPRDRGYCPLCHEYLQSRPTGFPQILAASHNPMKPCITCHDPHDPVPLETPRECGACHAAIARTKAVSHHVYVPCTRCHATPEQHKVSPREFRPGRPMTREFCGGCHAEDAPDQEHILKVDIATHGGRYVCWQCHYPHLPEGS